MERRGACRPLLGALGLHALPLSALSLTASLWPGEAVGATPVCRLGLAHSPSQQCSWVHPANPGRGGGGGGVLPTSPPSGPCLTSPLRSAACASGGGGGSVHACPRGAWVSLGDRVSSRAAPACLHAESRFLHRSLCIGGGRSPALGGSQGARLTAWTGEELTYIQSQVSALSPLLFPVGWRHSRLPGGRSVADPSGPVVPRFTVRRGSVHFSSGPENPGLAPRHPARGQA